MANETFNNLIVQGRLVWISGKTLFEGKAKIDYNTGRPVTNPDGSPVIEYGFGIAIAKLDPRTGQTSADFQKVWTALYQEAFTLFPNGQIPPTFAMKYKDGDGIDDKGRKFSEREGYAGHIVLACTTQLPLKCFIFQGGNNILVNTGIKCGDYVNAQINIKAHPAKGQGKAGLYLNPSAIQLIQPGKEIINSPSGDQIFGAVIPNYSGEVVPDVAPQMPMQQAPMAPAAPMYPQAPVVPQIPVQAPAAPHYGVLPQQMQPQTAPMAPAAPIYPQAPVAPQMPMGNQSFAIPTPGTVPSMNTMAPTANPAYPSSLVPPMPK